MLVFLLHILISFMVLGITLFSAHMVEIKSSSLENIFAIYGLSGIILVGIGIFIGGGGGESLHAYFYITFILQLIVLSLFLLVSHFFKKVGHSIFINICSICLIIISHLIYVYYIIASFIYW